MNNNKNKNIQETSISKAQTQQIVRLAKTKQLFQQEFILDSKISSLSSDAFSKLPKDTHTVLDYLLNCKYPLIWQSQITMAKNMGLHREDVNRALRLLRTLGIVDWFQRHNNSNVYRLHDIVYTYQFRQAYKDLFAGLNHPSFYALIPSWLKVFSNKITLILKNYLFKKDFNYKERQLAWQNCRKGKNGLNNLGVLLYVALSSRQEKQEKPINIPLRGYARQSLSTLPGKKRKESNYFPNPSSGRPLPQRHEVLASIKDDGLRKALEDWGNSLGYA